jgi:hypothetical protein
MRDRLDELGLIENEYGEEQTTIEMSETMAERIRSGTHPRTGSRIDDPMSPEVQAIAEGKGLGGMASTSFNFANSIIGAGVIGIPFGMNEAGIGLGLILLWSMAFVTDWSVQLLVKTGRIAGKDSYQAVASFAFGRKGLYAISLFQFIFAFGGA